MMSVDISADKLSSFSSWLLIILPMIGFIISLFEKFTSSRIERKTIPLLGLSNDDIDRLNTKKSFLSKSTLIVFSFTTIFGIISLLSNNKVQEKLKSQIGETKNKVDTANATAKQSFSYSQEAMNKTDFLSEQIKNINKSGAVKRELTPEQTKAFQSLEMLKGEKVCLVSVSNDSEEQHFFNEIKTSLYAYNVEYYQVFMREWNTQTIDLTGSQPEQSYDSHSGIQIYDRKGENGPLYQAIKIAGLSPKLIGSLPLSCNEENDNKPMNYGIVIGKNI